MQNPYETRNGEIANIWDTEKHVWQTCSEAKAEESQRLAEWTASQRHKADSGRERQRAWNERVAAEAQQRKRAERISKLRARIAALQAELAVIETEM